MRIRMFESRDAADWARIFHEAVHQVAVRHYSPAQRAAWSPAPISEDMVLAHVSDGRSVFVAVDETDRAQGFIELEGDGHIDCFYCAPAAVGCGVGVLLYDRLEAEARNAGITLLFVEASEAAKGFFLRQGFTLETRREFERRGVMLHNYSMKKQL